MYRIISLMYSICYISAMLAMATSPLVVGLWLVESFITDFIYFYTFDFYKDRY